MEKKAMTTRDAHQSDSDQGSDYRYPFAAAPDIIRAHQKDAYFQGVVHDRISDVLRRLYGARFLHTHAQSSRTLSDLLYLGVTTLLGNRTLGEEYCDLVQVENNTLRLPAAPRRAGYIIATLLLPYYLSRVLPSIRNRLQHKLRTYLDRSEGNKAGSKSTGFADLGLTYLLAHLDSISSLSPYYAVSLAVFYFTGAYYHLGKRLFGLRYIFNKRLEPGEQRVGYEVLGALLVVQMLLQSWIHLRQQLESGSGTSLSWAETAGSASSIHHRTRVEKSTHTPCLVTPRYDLQQSETMTWIEGRQRKCTLCLEDMRDPSATTCGHIFCWTCIGGWARERPECPLCRQPSLPQHILPLRDDRVDKA
ncbi:MAG: peroxisome biogenesis factor 10 [Phylliscum demangeonii]|nr:MAG: peroxisome biogenesis factor 10 [Phylliscum demangeonii]